MVFMMTMPKQSIWSIQKEKVQFIGWKLVVLVLSHSYENTSIYVNFIYLSFNCLLATKVYDASNQIYYIYVNRWFILQIMHYNISCAKEFSNVRFFSLSWPKYVQVFFKILNLLSTINIIFKPYCFGSAS